MKAKVIRAYVTARSFVQALSISEEVVNKVLNVSVFIFLLFMHKDINQACCHWGYLKKNSDIIGSVYNVFIMSPEVMGTDLCECFGECQTSAGQIPRKQR